MVEWKSSPRLSQLTTLRVGGGIGEYVEVREEATLIEMVRRADEQGRAVLVLGGGSNLLAGDGDDFDGVVVAVRPDTDGMDGEIAAVVGSRAWCGLPVAAIERGVSAPDKATATEAVGGGVVVSVFAGVDWDIFVAQCVAANLVGVEALSGIPGTVGATPVQNVGAYGQDVSQTIGQVRTYDRESGRLRTFSAADCAFGYRDSVFKRTPYRGLPGPTGRYVVLSVSFRFRQGTIAAPIAYRDLADYLAVDMGSRPRLADVREAVLAVRARKGMVLAPGDHDTWSAGSFFTNPILAPEEAARLPTAAPRFGLPDGRIKTSAAWLLTQSGFDRGFAVGPSASLSTKHPLALTNRGEADASDIVELARAVQSGVEERFGIRLEPEPVRLGVGL